MIDSGRNILIGTSGWNYKEWKGVFYPPDLGPDKWLEFYAQTFDSVEINNSFYQLPERKTFRNWNRIVPSNFVFSVKASRYITHMKKLKEPKEALKRFLKRIEALDDHLGPVLFQLPPRWSFNEQRLSDFLNLLSRDFMYVFEFRDHSWWNETVYQLLSGFNAAFCVYDLDRRLSPKKLTSDFAYFRLHGPNGPYKGKYDTQTLSGWAGTISAWRKKCNRIYCYFDNDQRGYAVKNAQQLQEMLTKDSNT